MRMRGERERGMGRVGRQEGRGILGGEKEKGSGFMGIIQGRLFYYGITTSKAKKRRGELLFRLLLLPHR